MAWVPLARRPTNRASAAGAKSRAPRASPRIRASWSPPFVVPCALRPGRPARGNDANELVGGPIAMYRTWLGLTSGTTSFGGDTPPPRKCHPRCRSTLSPMFPVAQPRGAVKRIETNLVASHRHLTLVPLAESLPQAD
jgi:hypothetical protein